MFDPKQIRTYFPIFSHDPGLVYLDNAATTQKPKSVINSIAAFYEKENTNVHRGIYEMAAKVSLKYEQVRERVAAYIKSSRPENIIFTAGTTAGINLVANSFLEPRLEAGDEVVVSIMEHHANFIPWQQVCKRKGAKFLVAPVSDKGELDMQAFKGMLSNKTKMVAVAHVSNTMGSVNPIGELIEMAHAKAIPVLVDSAQSIAHFDIDVKELDADFLVFSGHKMFGPTGVGVLYGKEEHLAGMTPTFFGGNAIRNVQIEETEFAYPPRCFEPGTPNIAGVIGLDHALDLITSLDRQMMRRHLCNLTQEAIEKLKPVKKLHFVGSPKDRSPIISFILENVHPHDVATFLGAENIAVRAGHHCTQPLMERFGITGTVRVSFSIYNTLDDVEKLVDVVQATQKFFV